MISVDLRLPHEHVYILTDIGFKKGKIIYSEVSCDIDMIKNEPTIKYTVEYRQENSHGFDRLNVVKRHNEVFDTHKEMIDYYSKLDTN